MSTLQTAITRDGVAARGIGFAVLSYASFSTADAIIKLASARFSVFQIAFTVALFALLPVLGLTAGRGGWRALLPHDWRMVALRGALTAVGGLLAWQGFAMLPLSEVYAILFAAPIMVTVMSVLLLREEVGWRRWSAQAVGFAGVLVMIRPDFSTLGLGHLLTAHGGDPGCLGADHAEEDRRPRDQCRHPVRRIPGHHAWSARPWCRPPSSCPSGASSACWPWPAS